MPYMMDLCARAPRSVVHGDFVTRNLRVRSADHEHRLLAVDWETAGWGCPVSDLAQSPDPDSRSWARVDMDEYWSVVRGRWNDVDHATVLEWAVCATVVRCVSVVAWDAPLLLSDWPTDRIVNMAYYDDWLARATDAAGWGPA